MSAYLVLLLAILSRILPHAFHTTSVNFTAVGGGLLFFGSRRGRSQALVAVAAMALTDFYLTTYAYGYPFHLRGYLATWAWYGAVCLLGHGLLSEKRSVLRVGAAVLASSTSFFVVSNFMVWAGGGLYPHNAAGLGACFVAGIPFYANDLMSTAVTAGALFGLPVLAKTIVATIRGAQGNGLRLG